LGADMKIYLYTDIKKITKSEIIFYDGFVIDFEECKKEWANKNRIDYLSTNCVVTRNKVSNPPCFTFYTKERTVIHFKRKGFFKKRRALKDFAKLQFLLNDFGFSSYDLS
jgi:hypothetical protein